MKKLTALLLVLCLLLPLAACGEKTPAATEPTQPAQPTQTAEPAQTTEPAQPAEPAQPTEPTPAPEPEPEPVVVDPYPEPELPELTLEALQKAVQETGLAYYYKNPYMQYDSMNMTAEPKRTGVVRTTSHMAPEDVAFDAPDYSVCSDFAYQIYNDAFGYQLCGSAFDTTTTNMTKNLAANDPICVVKYGGEDGMTDQAAALKQARECLLPGDIIVGYGNTGHALIYIGDALGDGVEYVIHCWGSKINKDSGSDAVEKDGAIIMEPVDKVCFEGGASKTWILSDPTRGATFTIVRPLNVIKAEELTPSGESRLRYPGIDISKALDRSVYQDVVNGDIVPVTVTVTNHSKEAYKNLHVTEYVPEGQKLVDGSVSGNGACTDGVISWIVDVPAGETMTFTYSIEIQGKNAGEMLEFPAGLVSQIPVRAITLKVGGCHLTEEQEKVFLDASQGVIPTEVLTAKANGLGTVNELYKILIGTEAGLPETTAEVLDALTYEDDGTDYDGKVRKILETPKAGYENVAKMVIPLHITGWLLSNGNNAMDRVLLISEENYRPGDIFIRFGKSQMIYLYLGNGIVLTVGESGNVGLNTFDSTVPKCVVVADQLIALRPTQAFTDFANKK